MFTNQLIDSIEGNDGVLPGVSCAALRRVRH